METRVIHGDTVYLLKLDPLGKDEAAQVFPAYLEDEDPDQVKWAIKLAKNQEHNAYIEREYEIIKKLHQVMPVLPDTASLSQPPTVVPIVQLGISADGRKALIMQPLPRYPLLEIFEGLTDSLEREKLALTAARQYIVLLKAIGHANLSCLDRKLEDLWWVGSPDSGHLVVTDWNAVSDTSNYVMDLRGFGHLWLELVIGQQMPLDFQALRRDFEQVQDKLSYGLWYVISRALGSKFGSIRELADVLDRLVGYYRQEPATLIGQARDDLKEAQLHLNRNRADWAWIQFDIAQRLDGRSLDTELEQAQLWAYNPVAQAAPDLIRKLASPQFSEAGKQLHELKHKAQRPQELGEIGRWQYGLDLLNMAQDIMIKSGAASDLTRITQEFAQVQDLLIIGVLRSLNTKDGSTAYKNLQELTHMLPQGMTHGGLERVISLELEALFWVAYQDVQHNLHTDPHQAMLALEKARTSRAGVSHWPNDYEPSVTDLERLQAVIETNLQTMILAGDTTPTIEKDEPIETEVTARPIIASEMDTNRPILGEDLVVDGKGEGITELLARLAVEPENDQARDAVRQMLLELKQKHQALTESRSTPSRLAARAGILEVFLQIPENFGADLLTRPELDQELAEIRQLENQVAQGQQEFFRNPGQALARALENEYELFDDVAMSVAALKVIHESGQWDNQKYDQEITELEKQADRFLTMSNLLEARKQELEQTMAVYASLSKEPAITEVNPFLANTLRLYLTTAQAQLQAGENATDSMNRANHLLESARRILDPREYKTYQNLYEHLNELTNGKSEPMLELGPSASQVVESQLVDWFKAYRFEACYQSLVKLNNHAQKKKWETRLSHARRLKDVLARGEPQIINSRFRKKHNIQLYLDALSTLRKAAITCEPMAYDLYKDQTQKLYEQIWQSLAQLDKKSAQSVESKLRFQRPVIQPT